MRMIQHAKVGSRAGSDSDAVVADQHADRLLPGLRTACPGLQWME